MAEVVTASVTVAQTKVFESLWDQYQIQDTNHSESRYA